MEFILSDKIPKRRRFLINYNDLITQPAKVLNGLLEWLPLLGEMSLNTQEIPPKLSGKQRHGIHGSSLYDYVFSDECKFTRKNETTVNTKAMNVWRDFVRQQDQFQLDAHF